jgi:hypothetical protein
MRRFDHSFNNTTLMTLAHKQWTRQNQPLANPVVQKKQSKHLIR